MNVLAPISVGYRKLKKERRQQQNHESRTAGESQFGTVIPTKIAISQCRERSAAAEGYASDPP
jgi:hypothetical protein